MNSANFPSKRLKSFRPELAAGADEHPRLYGYVESHRADVATAPAYVSFVDYWRLLMQYKKTLLCFAASGLILAILVSFLQTPIYRARISVEIQDFNENFLDLKNVDPTTNSAGPYPTAESYFQTQIKILHSESLLERVIDKLNLRQPRPETGWRAWASRLRRKLGGSQAPRLPAKEGLIQQAKRNLSVRTDGTTRLLEVLYESPDPKLAADFANALVNEFIEQSQEMRWKSTQRTGEWLTSHLDEMKANLERSEAKLQDYARASGLTFTSENNNVAEIKLKELQEELSKAQADRVAKEARFQEAKNNPAESLPETLDDPALREYRLKLTDLQRQLVELSATLTPAHYKVRRVQAQIDELRAAVRRERRLIVRRVGNEYAAARRREALLSQAYAQQEKLVADQSSKAIRYDTLKREVDSSRQLYESMLQRVKQAELAAAMRVNNVLVVDPAKPPLLPYKPQFLFNSALGIFGGMFLGLGFVLLRERFDRTIKAPGDAQLYLNLPELGVIPLADTLTREISGNGNGHTLTLPAPSDVVFQPSAEPSLALATWSAKPSLLAESIRATLTSILLADQDGDHARVVVLTSPCRGDGKTTVICNLSIAMAELGRKVLLIDGDLRRPRVHQVFGLSNSHGLSNLLCSETPLDSLPSFSQMTETKIPGLHVLPSGTRSSISSVTLFYSARMSGLLERFRREFDMVLVDAPPMIQLADARILARLSDGVVLVMRAGQTTPQSALIISQRFTEDGTRVLGTILNAWDAESTAAYGYYGPKEYYGEYGTAEK